MRASLVSGRPSMRPITSTGLPPADLMPRSTPEHACVSIFMHAEAETMTRRKYFWSCVHGLALRTASSVALGEVHAGAMKSVCGEMHRPNNRSIEDGGD